MIGGVFWVLERNQSLDEYLNRPPVGLCSCGIPGCVDASLTLVESTRMSPVTS
jgi:hypothetical protein